MEKHRIAAEKWMQENPRAYNLFERFMYEMIESGRKRVGAKMIAERIRWECHLRKVESFKWNNNYTAYVARKWQNNNPLFAGYIVTRERKEKVK